MRVGLLADVAWPGEEASAAGLARLQAASEQGYDAVWLQDAGVGGALSAALLFAAAQLAGGARAPGLGLCCQPSGSIHPLRVAEELAVLDIMSAGRLEWALAPDAEGWEVLEIVLHAWRGELFEFEGTHHRVPETSCHPTPLRDPHPAIWIADESAVPEAVPLQRHGHVVGLTAPSQSRSGDEQPHALARLLVLDERDARARERAEVVLASLRGRALGVGEAILDFVIAGDADACRDQLEWLCERQAPDVLIVAPDPEVSEPESLAEWQRRFAEQVLARR